MKVDFSKQQKRLDFIKDKLSDLSGFFSRELLEVQPLLKTVLSDDKLEAKLVLHLKREINLEQYAFLFGEIVHQLRSVLDNMVLSIGQAILSPSTSDLKTLSFPICDTEEIWSKGVKRFNGLPENIVTMLKHVQPFNSFGVFTDGTGNLLTTLRDFDNHDKHYFQLEPKYEQREGKLNISLRFADESAAIRAAPPKMEIINSPFTNGSEFIKFISVEPLHGIQGTYGIGASVSFSAGKAHYEALPLLLNAYSIVEVVLDLFVATCNPGDNNFRVLKRS